MNQDDDPTASYDPRSWFAPAAPFAPPSAAAAPVSPMPFALRPRVARSIAAAIAIGGAAAAYLARPTEGHSPTAAVAPSLTISSPTENRSLVVDGAGAVEPSLRAIGVDAAAASAASRAIATRFGAAPGELRLNVVLRRAGDTVGIAALSATRADGFGIALHADGRGGMTATPLTAQLATRLKIVRGRLDGESFYTSAVTAGVNDVLVGEFANAFRYDFDMQREVAKGDAFTAGYDQSYNRAGEPVGVPVLIYAGLSTAAKTRTLYRFRPPGEREAAWFDGAGHSAQRALMRTPVEAARVSSGFGFRLHPILGFMKLHAGIDFAAPVGTPIFAAGDAVVVFAGPKGPNGNFVKLRHPNGWETLYLHMNRIWPGVVAGAHVAQGQQIGEVGTTGRSTGPHLHYEVHIDGKPVNPQGIDTGAGRTLTGGALRAFQRERDRIDSVRTRA